jgi:hypothetical protein
MPILLTTSNHENPLLSIFHRAGAEPQSGRPPFCLYLFLSTYNLLRFSLFTSKTRQNLPFPFFLSTALSLGIFLSCLARRLGASLYTTFL